MKKFAVILLMMGLTHLVFVKAQDHNAKSASASQAEIKVDKMEHDYGEIMQGDNGECEFTVTNVGKEPLIINNCMGSCGCTVPQCPTEPILPGKSAKIKVKYDTNRVGGIYKTVTVNSNAKNGVITLTIKGNVKPKPVEEVFPQNPTSKDAPVEKKGS